MLIRGLHRCYNCTQMIVTLKGRTTVLDDQARVFVLKLQVVVHHCRRIILLSIVLNFIRLALRKGSGDIQTDLCLDSD